MILKPVQLDYVAMSCTVLYILSNFFFISTCTEAFCCLNNLGYLKHVKGSSFDIHYRWIK